MAVTVVGTPASGISDGATSTYSLTVPAGCDLIVVGVCTNVAGSVTTVTWNGVSLTFKDNSDASGTEQLWYLLAPTAATGNVVVSCSGNNVASVAVCFSGVDQSTPFGTVAKATGVSGTSPSVTVTGATGDLFVDVEGAFFYGVNQTGHAASGQTAQGNTNSSAAGASCNVSTKAGAASDTMGWGVENNGVSWSQLAVAVKAVASGPVTYPATIHGRFPNQSPDRFTRSALTSSNGLSYLAADDYIFHSKGAGTGLTGRGVFRGVFRGIFGGVN